MSACIFDHEIFDPTIFHVCGRIELNGVLLHVWHDGFEENRELVRSESFVWDTTLARVVRHVHPFGSVRTWRLHCFEESVNWANSIVLALQGMVDDNTTVTFEVAYGTLHIVTITNVKVLAVNPVYPGGSNTGTRQRDFIVVLQEIP